MPTTYTEGTRTGEHVLSEANGARSREVGTLASGNLPAGAVLALNGAGDYVPLAPAAADGTEVRDVTEVTIKMDNSISYTILSDPGQGLAERAMQEQFLF